MKGQEDAVTFAVRMLQITRAPIDEFATEDPRATPLVPMLEQCAELVLSDEVGAEVYARALATIAEEQTRRAS